MIDTPKQALRWTGLRPRSNHAGHLFGVAELVDNQGVTLPGLTLQIEIKAPVDAARCLFLFSLMRLQHGKRRRLYQLEVSPHNKRTHNGQTAIYGPHEHIEDDTNQVTDPAVRCDNWFAALQWFFNRVSVQPFEIEDPHHAEL